MDVWKQTSWTQAIFVRRVCKPFCLRTEDPLRDSDLNRSIYLFFFLEATIKRMGKSESQMDIMEKSSKPGKRGWTMAEIGLSVLLLLVSCALAGLVVLYTSALKGTDNTSRLSLSLVAWKSVCVWESSLRTTGGKKQNKNKSYHANYVQSSH